MLTNRFAVHVVDRVAAVIFSSVQEVIGLACTAKPAHIPVTASFIAPNCGGQRGSETLEKAITRAAVALETRSAPNAHLMKA